MSGQMSWLWLLTLIALSTAACSLVPTPSAEAREMEAMVQAYYEAVRRGDIEAQLALWTASAREEGRRQGQAWTKRRTDGLLVGGFHAEDTGEPGLKIAHYDLLVKDGFFPEGKVALVENVEGAWRIRQVR